MADLGAILAANRNAIDSLIATAEKSPGQWNTPCAPGKWSPAQIVEHVARSLDESANLVAGRPAKFPKFPFFLRPIARTMFFNRVMKNQAFSNARTNKAMDPAADSLGGLATPAHGRARLAGAVATFEDACRAASAPTVNSLAFGRVPLTEWALFQVLHAKHHEQQIKTNR